MALYETGIQGDCKPFMRKFADSFSDSVFQLVIEYKNECYAEITHSL